MLYEAKIWQNNAKLYYLKTCVKFFGLVSLSETFNVFVNKWPKMAKIMMKTELPSFRKYTKNKKFVSQTLHDITLHYFAKF